MGNKQIIDGMTIHEKQRSIEIRYAKPEWSKDEEQYFMYQGNRYYLSEFMAAKSLPLGYEGSMHFTAFSGLFVKFIQDRNNDTRIKVAYVHW